MADIQTDNQNAPQEGMNVQDILWGCLRRWWWFIISLIICVGAAYIYILRTPPLYTRSASILIKDNSKGGSTPASAGDAFSDLGIFSTSVNINNEMATLRSPDMIAEVVSRLRLDVAYTADGRFHSETLYGEQLPVTVTFVDFPTNGSAAFDAKVERNGKITASNFSLGGQSVADQKPIVAKAGDTVPSPIGPLVFAKGPAFPGKYSPAADLHVAKSSVSGAANAYAGRLTVAQADNRSNIITLSLTDLSTKRAEDFLNSLIAVYNENWVKDKNQIAVSTSMFINDRLGVIESELGNVDNDISSFKSENLLPDVEGAASMYMAQANQASQNVQSLNNEVYMARYVRNYLANDANRNELLPINAGVDGLNISSQISQYNNLLLERNSLVNASSEANPLVVEMDKQAAGLRSAMISSIDNQLVSLNAQIRTAQGIGGRATSQIASNPKQAKYLLSVERQQKVKESLYLYLLQKREENELSQAFTAYNTRVIQTPVGSNVPTAPVRDKILLVAALIGLLIPLGLVFLLETANNMVRGRKDLENMPLPFAGEIPQHGKKISPVRRMIADWYKDMKEKTQQAAGKKHGKKQEPESVPTIVVKRHSRDVINEAFRVVRTNLEFMLGENDESKCSTIAITSANPGSGKTFISFNLGASMVLKGKKVLCIDLDLRKASLSRYIGSPKVGVADYLAAQPGVTIDDIIHHTPGGDNESFDIIPVGSIPPNPTELLFSKRLSAMLKDLATEYDYIFLDCPPVEIVADATIINKYTDMTLFVVRAGLYRRSMLPDLEKMYRTGRYHNLTMLLNGTEQASVGYRYGYHYGYSSSYGYGSYAYGN